MSVDLSIIIPVYNTAPYLRDCLNSVINSKLGKYEVIIIDDGSTDDSYQIIEEFSQKHCEIKYKYQDNSGQGVARNVGIKEATGKYIYFMDSDDVLDKQKFTEVLKKIKTENLDCVFFDGKTFLDEEYHNEDNLLLFNYKRHKSYGKFSSGEDIFSNFSVNGEMLVSPCLYIVKREIILENNLFFPINMKHEDEVFTTILFFYLSNCCHVNELVFLRRLRPNSTMTTQNYAKSFHYHAKVLQHLNEFYSSFNFKSAVSKKHYFNNMRNIYIKCLILMNKSQLNNELDDKHFIKKIAKRYNYFDKFGFLASKNIILYKLISRIYLFFRNEIRIIKRNKL